MSDNEAVAGVRPTPDIQRDIEAMDEWRLLPSGKLDARDRLAADVAPLLAQVAALEAERDDAYARGFEQVRRRCERAEAEVARYKAAGVEIERQWRSDEHELHARSENDAEYDYWLGRFDAGTECLDDLTAALGDSIFIRRPGPSSGVGQKPDERHRCGECWHLTVDDCADDVAPAYCGCECHA